MPGSLYGALAGAPDMGAAGGAMPQGPLMEALARIAAARRQQMLGMPQMMPPQMPPPSPMTSFKADHNAGLYRVGF